MTPSDTLKRDIREGSLDARLAELYGVGRVNAQRDRYIDAIEAFEETFGTRADAAIFSAPGRTEIGGNHTDHNNGLVLAAAVTSDIIAVVSRRNDQTVRVKSRGFENMDILDAEALAPRELEAGHSASLIRGLLAGFHAKGVRVHGFDAYTISDVPRGSGLSSSAAFEVLIGAVINGLFAQGRITPTQIAILGQEAENRYFGKPSGLMDQLACATGGVISVDFKDPKAPLVEKIPAYLSDHGIHLVITDTGGSHADLTPDYADIRYEMESVAGYFGKKVLREITMDDVLAHCRSLRGACGDRAVVRAIHYFEECRRAPILAHALRGGDMRLFLSLIREGGHSSFEYNQNAYSLRDPRTQGLSVALGLSQIVLQNEGAWRLQGGGFAGTIQAFVPDALLARYTEALESTFGQGACQVIAFRGPGCTAVVE